MKKEYLLNLGIKEDIANKVISYFSEEIKSFIPKVKFKEVNDNVLKLKEDLKERNLQLEKLKSFTDSIEDMKKEIERLQKENKIKDEKHALAIKKMKIETEISKALKNANAKNEKATKALLELDLDKIEFNEDGSIKGLDKQIKKLIESEDTSFLFNTQKGKTKFRGLDMLETKREVINNNIDISKLDYEHLVDYIEQNPNITI